MRTRSVLVAACLATAGIGSLHTAAQAGTAIFFGTRSNVDAPGPQSPRCGARTTINIRNGPNSTSVGLSNFGAFDPTLSHCIQLPPPGPFDLGEFTFDFGGGDTFFGTYQGVLAFNAPGVFDVMQDHIVTGGTGRYAGASGSFASSGLFQIVNGRPTVTQTFRGSITAVGIPEPATWGLMILGFGLAGARVRQRPIAARELA